MVILVGLGACYGGMYELYWGKDIHFWGQLKGLYIGDMIVASVFRWFWRDQSGWGLFRRVFGTFEGLHNEGCSGSKF